MTVTFLLHMGESELLSGDLRFLHLPMWTIALLCTATGVYTITDYQHMPIKDTHVQVCGGGRIFFTFCTIYLSENNRTEICLLCMHFNHK